MGLTVKYVSGVLQEAPKRRRTRLYLAIMCYDVFLTTFCTDMSISTQSFAAAEDVLLISATAPTGENRETFTARWNVVLTLGMEKSYHTRRGGERRRICLRFGHEQFEGARPVRQPC